MSGTHRRAAATARAAEASQPQRRVASARGALSRRGRDAVYTRDLLSATLRRVGTTTLETPAWLMRGVITYDAKLGTLRLDQGRLSFRESGAEAPVFDLALADIEDLKFPRYNLGSVVRFDAGAKRYRLAFLASERRFKWAGARISDVRPARRWGRQWKAALSERR